MNDTADLDVGIRCFRCWEANRSVPADWFAWPDAENSNTYTHFCTEHLIEVLQEAPRKWACFKKIRR